jgi:hypothetical protein
MLVGSCLCKGIRFQIAGAHSKVIVCHCSLCRKTSGTSSAAYIVIGYDQLTWLSGQDLVKSGPKHSFCRECGAHAPDSNSRKIVLSDITVVAWIILVVKSSTLLQATPKTQRTLPNAPNVILKS